MIPTCPTFPGLPEAPRFELSVQPLSHHHEPSPDEDHNSLTSIKGDKIVDAHLSSIQLLLPMLNLHPENSLLGFPACSARLKEAFLLLQQVHLRKGIPV